MSAVLTEDVLAPAGLLVLVLAVTMWLTGIVRSYALHARLLDRPGARRSHRRVTPRGGGVAIAAVSLPVFCWLSVDGMLHAADAWALCGAGLLVAGVGFMDDHRSLSPGWRLAVHLLAAGWGLYWLAQVPPGGSSIGQTGTAGVHGMPDWMAGLPAALLPTVITGYFTVLVPLPGPVAGLLVMVFLVIALAWLLNLYNFMDGIDAMATLQAVVICLAGALLHAVSGHPELMMAPLVTAAASAGFLYWNLPPARIFLGDAGSGFLGIVIGILALQAGRADPALLVGWIILASVFLTDSGVTLLRRILRGEPVWRAHREHVYQHLARRCASHGSVSAGFALATALWSTPLAVLVAVHWIEPWTGLLAAFLLPGWVAWILGAGRADTADDAASTIDDPEFL